MVRVGLLFLSLVSSSCESLLKYCAVTNASFVYFWKPRSLFKLVIIEWMNWANNIRFFVKRLHVTYVRDTHWATVGVSTLVSIQTNIVLKNSYVRTILIKLALILNKTWKHHQEPIIFCVITLIYSYTTYIETNPRVLKYFNKITAYTNNPKQPPLIGNIICHFYLVNFTNMV